MAYYKVKKMIKAHVKHMKSPAYKLQIMPWEMPNWQGPWPPPPKHNVGRRPPAKRTMTKEYVRQAMERCAYSVIKGGKKAHEACSRSIKCVKKHAKKLARCTARFAYRQFRKNKKLAKTTYDMAKKMIQDHVKELAAPKKPCGSPGKPCNKKPAKFDRKKAISVANGCIGGKKCMASKRCLSNMRNRAFKCIHNKIGRGQHGRVQKFMMEYMKQLYAKAKRDRRRYFNACRARSTIRQCMPAGCSKSVKCIQKHTKAIFKCAHNKIKDGFGYKHVNRFIGKYIETMKGWARRATMSPAQKKVADVKRILKHAQDVINRPEGKARKA